MEEIELAALIGSLRSELESAAAAREGDLVFGVGPVELELSIGVTREKGGGGGVKFWVLSLQGEAKRTVESVHKITLTLTPRHRTSPGQDVYVGDLD